VLLAVKRVGGSWVDESALACMQLRRPLAALDALAAELEEVEKACTTAVKCLAETEDELVGVEAERDAALAEVARLRDELGAVGPWRDALRERDVALAEVTQKQAEYDVLMVEATETESRLTDAAVYEADLQAKLAQHREAVRLAMSRLILARSAMNESIATGDSLPIEGWLLAEKENGWLDEITRLAPAAPAAGAVCVGGFAAVVNAGAKAVG
jgi:hypothetical protein